MLRGEHYGTPADVFSFAIVMCELMTLSPPYSDKIKGGENDSNTPMSWEQIVALTHNKDVMLRPTISDEIDDETSALLRSCWAHDPETRPSFSVILVRLRGLQRRQSISRSLSRSRREVTALAKLESSSLCRVIRSLHDLLWLFDSPSWDNEAKRAESLLVSPGVTVTSNDKTLRDILSAEKGLDCIRSLGWVMFGGLEDGAKIVPEPLVDTHITCDASSFSGLIEIHFAVHPPPTRVQWKTADSNEFDVFELALSKMGEDHGQTEDLELHRKAIGTNARRRRSRTKKRQGSGKNKQVKDFMKAAKFVRGVGAGTLF